MHFEKARGFTGADAVPFEAALHLADGTIDWQTSDLKQHDKTAAFEMFANGSRAARDRRRLRG